MGRDNMISFGSYLKDYLEYNNISQSEFALRLGITQKHMNEILAGKQNITLNMAGSIERLTNIPSSFIISIENKRELIKELLDKYESEDNLEQIIKKNFCYNELKKNEWVLFKDETNVFQSCIDILNFLNVKDFDAFEKLKNYTLFKKTGNDYNKLALWIAHCDKLIVNQKVGNYDSDRFSNLINELLVESYKKDIYINSITNILNKYGIFFVCEKALPGTKVRGCFKVKGKTPTIYVTKNYSAKDSFYFELFHELGHCKSDYSIAQSKTIIDGDEYREKRADEFAIKTMISDSNWNEIIKLNLNEKDILNYSRKNKTCMSFIVGRLAKEKHINYNSNFYNKYKNM